MLSHLCADYIASCAGSSLCTRNLAGETVRQRYIHVLSKISWAATVQSSQGRVPRSEGTVPTPTNPRRSFSRRVSTSRRKDGCIRYISITQEAEISHVYLVYPVRDAQHLDQVFSRDDAQVLCGGRRWRWWGRARAGVANWLFWNPRAQYVEFTRVQAEPCLRSNRHINNVQVLYLEQDSTPLELRVVLVDQAQRLQQLRKCRHPTRCRKGRREGFHKV